MKLQIAFDEAIRAFGSEFALGKLNNRQIAKFKSEQNFRLGTLTLESALSDLAQCCITSTEKRGKRKSRISLIRELHPGATHISSDTRFTLAEVDKLDDGVDPQGDSSDVLLDRLISEITSERKLINEISVFQCGGKWIPPVSKQFHGFCTKTVNQEGDVYDLMSEIAGITLHRLLLSTRDDAWSELALRLLAGAQIIFKGGVALGTFIFKKSRVWETLSAEDKDRIITAFIAGGDNDTSLHFATMKDIKKDASIALEQINREICQIAKKTTQILWDVCLNFQEDIMSLLNKKSLQLETQKFQFGTGKFGFKARSASGFDIQKRCKGEITNVEQTTQEADDDFLLIEEEPDADVIGDEAQYYLCYYPSERRPQQVFTSQSTVEFPSPFDRDENVAFELVRAKLGFTAQCDDIQINTYSELLDISIEYAHSACLYKKQFTSVYNKSNC